MAQALMRSLALICLSMFIPCDSISESIRSAIVWVPCPVATYAKPANRTSFLHHINLAQTSTSGPPPVSSSAFVPAGGDSDGVISECAMVPVPLDHAQPSLGSIEIFVKRLRRSGATPTHAVWMLAGGPGDASADDVEPLHSILFDRLMARKPGAYEVFVTDHRGVGRSTRLGCKRSQAETPGSPGGIEITISEYPGCILELDLDYPNHQSKAFSTENAAHDVHLLSERLRRPQQLVDIYGISYGTYWVGRYLRLYPSSARAVVLDGVVGASGRPGEQFETFDRWDLKNDRVGRDVLVRCSVDQFCATKLGSDATTRTVDLFKRLAQGDFCAAPLARLGGVAGLKRLLGQLLYAWEARGIITALIYRLERCSASDAKAISHFVQYAASNSFPIIHTGLETPGGVPLRSEVLFRNVMFSELWDSAVNREALERWFNDSMFGINIWEDVPDLRRKWPLYPTASSFNTSLVCDSHLLFMNGDTDAQTPIWSARWEFESANTTSSKDMLTWRDATHFSVFNTPTTDGGDPCGLQAVVAFFLNPMGGAWRSLSCRQRLRRIEFGGDADTNLLLWGSRDAYEGPPDDDSTRTGSVLV